MSPLRIEVLSSAAQLSVGTPIGPASLFSAAVIRRSRQSMLIGMRHEQANPAFAW